MDWLTFSLSNHQQPCFFEPFNTSVQHDRDEEVGSASTDLAMVTGGYPKLENFLDRGTDEHGGGADAYESELKSIAAGLLGAGTEDTEVFDVTREVVMVDEEPKKVVDTFGQRTSIYRGVTRHRWTGRYEAHLWDNSCRREGQTRKGRQVYLGGYDKEEKAARAYDLAALKYWGPTTTTNFPVSNYEKELEEMKNMTRQEFVASLRRKSSGFSRGASIYRGVTRHHQHGRWQARIGRVAGNKDLYLGTFSTQEEAAEAYDIAAIKFRGPNAVTNFDISRYDVNSIMSSNLPIGSMAARTPKPSSSDPSPSSSPMFLTELPITKPSLNLMLPETQPQRDYWSGMLAIHQHAHQSPYFNLLPPPFNVSGYPTGNVTSIASPLVQEHGSSYDLGSECQDQITSIPYATPITLGNVYNDQTPTTTTNPTTTTFGSTWITTSGATVHQPATLFGIE